MRQAEWDVCHSTMGYVQDGQHSKMQHEQVLLFYFLFDDDEDAVLWKVAGPHEASFKV
jgi:hypothetical protein